MSGLKSPWLDRDPPLSPQNGGGRTRWSLPVLALQPSAYHHQPYSKSEGAITFVQLIFVPAIFFVISHHVPAFRFLIDFFLRHHVLIPSSHLFPIAKNNSVLAGRYYLAYRRAGSGFSPLAFFEFTWEFILEIAQRLPQVSPSPSNVSITE